MALWLHTTLAAAEALATSIVIEAPSRPDRLLDEAVLRIQGELAAMGLDAAVTRAGTSADAATEPEPPNESRPGRLTLSREGHLVRISAVGPSSPNPFVQEVDARGAEVTAEVVAVRAVEALRAVMTLPQRRAEPPEAEPAEPPKLAPKAADPPPLLPAASRASASIAPAEHGSFSVWSGLSAFYDRKLTAPGIGGELGLFWGRSRAFVGVTGSLTALSASVEADEGDVDVRRGNVFARVGYALPLAGPVEMSLMGGGGWSRYLIDGHANAGFVGQSARRDTPVLLASAAINAWFASHFAAYARVDATFGTNAPQVRANFRELSVLDRPTFWASLGLAVRLPSPLSP